MDFWVVTLLGGVSYGLLLFMLSAGLTLTFGLMGVLNFAHASFYMLGAYVACQLTQRVGFWPALLLAPLAVGVLGALFEHFVLRRIRARSGVGAHLPELLATFGLAYVLLEAVQLAWGRGPLDFRSRSCGTLRAACISSGAMRRLACAPPLPRVRRCQPRAPLSRCWRC